MRLVRFGSLVLFVVVVPGGSQRFKVRSDFLRVIRY